MEEIKFKTNIKCSGCLEKVGPHLNNTAGIESWDVDLHSAEKVLSVNVKDVSEIRLVNIVKEAGYNLEQI